MTSRSLPRPLVWLARRVIPPRHVPHVLADLADDYALERARRAPLAARWWLAREAASLVVVYARESLVRPLPSAAMWLRDARLAGRSLRHAPWAALGASALLAAGLVAVLVTAALADALLFRPVSTTHGDALRRIAATDRQGRTALRLSFPEVEVIREFVTLGGTTTLVNLQPAVLRARGTDMQTMAEVVDGEYFRLVGTPMALGRALLTTDDRPDAPPAVVITETLWRARFDGAAQVLGTTIDLNGSAYTIVGVAAALGSSSFLGASVDAWVPLAHADPILNRGWRRDVTSRWFSSYVLPSASMAEVESRLGAAAAELTRRYPDPWRDRRLHTAPSTVLTGSQRDRVLMLAGILSGLALLILATAASNVGGVFLARAAATRRQVAIHLAMGAGRTAVVRRQLLEGAVLGLGGAAMAVALYAWLRTALAEVALLPTLALRLDLRFDAAAISGVAAAGVLAGIALAWGPGWWAARVELAGTMRDGDGRTSTGAGLSRLRRALVAAQVALTLTLIVGAALFGRSLDALTRADLGFDRARLVAMDFDLEPASPLTSELPALAREALDRAARTPGILAAAMSNRAPVDQSTPGVEVSGPADSAVIANVSFNLATAGYFDTVGIPIVRGRSFTAEESANGADVAIVNETLAARLWPGGDALDRALVLPRDRRTLRIVGVARNARYRSIVDDGGPHFYRPTPPGLGLTLLARTAGDPRRALGDLQSMLDDVGPGLVGFFPRTLDDHLAIELLPTQAAATAASALGSLALLLSGVGLYGLVAWLVTLRRREIGVRLALGATRADVRRLVVADAVRATLPGVVIGAALAVSLAVLARSALYGVRPFDPAAFAAAMLALVTLVALASYLPARRATRIDPVDTLRAE
jgi:predicted permease